MEGEGVGSRAQGLPIGRELMDALSRYLEAGWSQGLRDAPLVPQ